MINLTEWIGQAYALTEEELRNAGDVGTFITRLYDWVIYIGVPLGALVIIYAGYIYVTSQGNPESIKTAKELIIGVLLGYALILLAGMILRNFVGVAGIT